MSIVRIGMLGFSRKEEEIRTTERMLSRNSQTKEAPLDEIEVTRDGETYVVKMPSPAFAAFAFWLMTQPKASEGNSEGKRKVRGRPSKEPEGSSE